MKKAVALLGGPVQLWPKDLKDSILVAKKNNDLIFASDRGSQFLLDMGIVPEVAIGDFDSLKKGELAQLEELRSILDIHIQKKIIRIQNNYLKLLLKNIMWINLIFMELLVED